jgi:hypothetical protein
MRGGTIFSLPQDFPFQVQLGKHFFLFLFLVEVYNRKQIPHITQATTHKQYFIMAI